MLPVQERMHYGMQQTQHFSEYLCCCGNYFDNKKICFLNGLSVWVQYGKTAQKSEKYETELWYGKLFNMI